MNKVLIIVVLLLTLTNLSFSETLSEFGYDKNNIYENNNSTRNSLINRLKNIIVGEPTGLTPPIFEQYPNLNIYVPSYMHEYYDSYGYGSHNTFKPAYSNSQVHILD